MQHKGGFLVCEEDLILEVDLILGGGESVVDIAQLEEDQYGG